tara:strand:+ start:35 stop:580 length:546 start_codon:yes stop_codon:yes gene_type:complete
MNNHFREIVFSFLGFFFKDFKYIKPDYIKGVGKYKFINNYLIGSLSGKKGFWKLVNKNSVIIEPENILINGEIKKSKLMKSLMAQVLYIQAINKIEIHSSVLIGPDVKIISADHKDNNSELYKDSPSIRIGEGTWISSNVVILPGTEIGKNCIVGAGSIVNKKFNDNSLICGNPAKFIKKI